ncbi:hypothetical protein ACWD7F_32830 [Streptomyces sp. NPDC005122]
MVNRTAWEEASLRLLDDVYAFAATGPRVHPDWRDDVLAVMNHEVDDPRGWNVIDWETDKEERTTARPSFPFHHPSRDILEERLFPVTPATAERLLVTMTYDWGPVPQDEETAASAHADARTLLSRYGEQISCYSNISRARATPSPDLTGGVDGWVPLTQYAGDFGFVVVSPEEVGVFWSFSPI